MAKKRANGEGSIRQRGKKSWEVRVYDSKEPDSKKRRKSIYARSYDEALIELKKLQYQINNGVHFYVSPNQTVGKWFEEWLITYGMISYKNTTYNAYQNAIHTYIIPCIGRIPLSQITVTDIQRMMNSLYVDGKVSKSGGLSPATLAKIKNILSKGFQQALAVNAISVSPMNGLVLPPIETPIIKTFTPEEKAVLFAEMHNYSIGFLIGILLTTGMRIGEALALTTTDVDLNNGKLSIKKNISLVRNKLNGKMEFILGTPKTKSGIRQFLITPYTVELFKMQLASIEEMKKAADSRWVNNNLMFPDVYGHYQSRQDIRKKHIKMQEAVGISEPKNLHALRHTFATDALNAGVSAQNLSGILGHKNGAITLEFYGHFNEREAYKQLCALDIINKNC